jgi:hypothetical protein
MPAEGHEQLSKLVDLKAGWYDGEGLSISPDAILRVKFTLYSMINEGSRGKFYIYPTVDGGIQVEWSNMALVRPPLHAAQGPPPGREGRRRDLHRGQLTAIQGIALAELLAELSGISE